LAVGVLTTRASARAATPDGAVDKGSITFSQPFDSRSELFGPGRVLMTEDESSRNSTDTPTRQFVVAGKVCMSIYVSRNLEQDFAWSRGGAFNFFERGECLEVLEHDRLHRVFSFRPAQERQVRFLLSA